MIEMVRRFLRQKSSSTGTIIALVLLALLAAPPLNANQGLSTLATLALLVLAAGSVSRDIGSGAIQMILSRPVTRAQYLFGRYIGILAAYMIFLAGAVLLAFGLGQIISRLATEHFGPVFSFTAAGNAIVDAFFEAALLAAILLFFSTFLGGWGDVLAVFLATLLLGSAQAVGSALNIPALAKAGKIAIENLHPTPTWQHIVRGHEILASVTGRYVLALVAYLTLAVVIFARREFSYGQE
jgi:ABC-type transport system involved in multi-copper enzyme maturation permease subunit